MYKVIRCCTMLEERVAARYRSYSRAVLFVWYVQWLNWRGLPRWASRTISYRIERE